MKLKPLADRFIEALKLDPKLLLIRDDQYQHLYDLWNAFTPGRSALNCTLDEGTHGFLRTDDAGRVVTSGINTNDPPLRQKLAVVHEGIHAIYGHPTNQPNHQHLHSLAGGLAHTIFPHKQQPSSTQIMFDSDEMDILRRLNQGDVDEFLDDDGVVLADDELYFRNPFKKKRKQASYATKTLPKSVNVDNKASAEILAAYRGWATPYIIKMFETGRVLIPTRGINRVNNYSEWSGWTHRTLPEFWRSLTAAMESTSLSKTAKIDSTRLITPNELTLGTTRTPTYPLMWLSGSVRAVGMVVRIALPTVPIAAASGNALAGTPFSYRSIFPPSVANIGLFADSAGRRRHFSLGFEPENRIAEFLVLCTENDRGSATVVGQDLSATPFAMLSGLNYMQTQIATAASLGAPNAPGTTDLNALLGSTAAGSFASDNNLNVVPQLGGCTVTIESLNMRDLVGDVVTH